MVVTADDGSVYLKQDPYNKDITLKLRILAELKGDQWLFHNNEIKVKQSVLIKTVKVDINGEIIKVFE
jgi:hypothetical protein